MNTLHIGFVMTTEAGLYTEYLNWKTWLRPELAVTPEWIVNTWRKEGSLVDRIPGIPRSVKARLGARMIVREGLAKGPFDALFIGSPSVLHYSRHALARQPYFVSADSTRKQLQSFGGLYKNKASRWPLLERAKEKEMAQMLQNAAGVLTLSRWAADSMIKDYGVDPARVQVTPPGFDLTQWTVPARETETHTTHILFVGGDFARKGGNLLLDWARTTSARDWILHLVTRDPITPPNENVRVYSDFQANDSALMELYRQAHLFVLPTRADCYSLAALEAMASGLPVILSRTGGTGEIIREGETGYLIPPDDGPALFERLEHLLAHPEIREAMGRAARRDVEERYDIRRNIASTVALMRGALEN